MLDALELECVQCTVDGSGERTKESVLISL